MAAGSCSLAAWVVPKYCHACHKQNVHVKILQHPVFITIMFLNWHTVQHCGSDADLLTHAMLDTTSVINIVHYTHSANFRHNRPQRDWRLSARPPRTAARRWGCRRSAGAAHPRWTGRGGPAAGSPPQTCTPVAHDAACALIQSHRPHITSHKHTRHNATKNAL